MRRVAIAALLALALPLGAACSDGCKVTSDCAQGQLCDFVSGDCLEGCTRDEECGQGRCDTRYGVCRAVGHSALDARTATTADAASSDASADDDGGARD